MQNIDVLRFKNILLTQCLLSTNNKVVVGVSGGPDSLCLLDLLARVKLPVLVAHYDHHLRPESGEDALRVRQAAARYGFPFFLGESDVAAYARQQKASIEEAARDCRYRFLFETAVNQQAEAVLVAHTADDQVETVLMHLLRGSGLAGLKGMTYRCVLETWNDRIPLLRPLLAYWREDILTYCQERGLQPVMDATNADITYFRNRLRHELIPYLSEYNPQFKRVLWRMALNLGGDFELVQDLTQHQAEALILAVESDAVVLKYTDLKLLNSGLQRNMLRMAIQDRKSVV